MSFTEFVLTDRVSTGSRENEDTLRDISGTVTLTPLITGPVRVPDDPAWTLTTAPITLTMEGGKLVGRDSEDGVRLVAMVDGQAIPWKVERRLVFQGKSIPTTPMTVVSTGEPVHLPDAIPVSDDPSIIAPTVLSLRDIIARLDSGEVPPHTHTVDDVIGLGEAGPTGPAIPTTAPLVGAPAAFGPAVGYCDPVVSAWCAMSGTHPSAVEEFPGPVTAATPYLDFAFSGMKRLRSVQISDASHIESAPGAFVGCESLESIVAPGLGASFIPIPPYSYPPSHFIFLQDTAMGHEDSDEFMRGLGTLPEGVDATLTLPLTAEGADVSLATNKGWAVEFQ